MGGSAAQMQIPIPNIRYQTYAPVVDQTMPAPSTVSSPPLAAAPSTTGAGMGGTAQQQLPQQQQQEAADFGGKSSRVLPVEILNNPSLRTLASSNPEVAQMMEYETTHGTTPAAPQGDAAAGGTPEGKYVDITDYLNMPQTRVAKTLGIPSSTLSKRWREAARQRKWPWRTVCKIDKEIMALLHNIPSGTMSIYKSQSGPDTVPPDVQTRLMALLRQRQEELKPVVIRL